MLDPIRLTSGHTNFLFSTLHNCLTEVRPDGQLAPLLAESFETGADASEWIFKLRKNVEFHHGKTLTADDVIASLNRHRGEDSASAMKSFRLASGLRAWASSREISVDTFSTASTTRKRRCNRISPVCGTGVSSRRSTGLRDLPCAAPGSAMGASPTGLVSEPGPGWCDVS